MMNYLHFTLSNTHPPKGANSGNIGHHMLELKRVIKPTWPQIRTSLVKHGACPKWVHYERQRYNIKQRMLQIERQIKYFELL